MGKIQFNLNAPTMRHHDAAIILPDEDPVDALVESIIESISTDLEVTLGGQTIFLAMLRNPDHWSDDWEAKGIDDPYEFIAACIEQEAAR